jgi:drug/metabolite transporter superfamily protein YnfA
MKLQTLRAYLECLSFVLWMVFTILSIALTGLGIEGIILAAFLLIISSTQPVHFPLAMAGVGGMGVFLSILWRQVGVDHFHYLQFYSPGFVEGEGESPSRVLKDLIREVEESSGYARNDARAKAKTWLIGHVSSLDEEDILLARAHFGYMLSAEWGPEAK